MATRPVLCVETGHVFNSIKDAAAWLEMTSNAISQAVRGLNPRAGGYHWEYVSREKPKKAKHRNAPNMTIEEVQKEAERRTKETGRYTRYADIQKEETVALIRRREERERLKKAEMERRKKEAKR